MSWSYLDSLHINQRCYDCTSLTETWHSTFLPLIITQRTYIFLLQNDLALWTRVRFHVAVAPWQEALLLESKHILRHDQPISTREWVGMHSAMTTKQSHQSSPVGHLDLTTGLIEIHLTFNDQFTLYIIYYVVASKWISRSTLPVRVHAPVSFCPCNCAMPPKLVKWCTILSLPPVNKNYWFVSEFGTFFCANAQ